MLEEDETFGVGDHRGASRRRSTPNAGQPPTRSPRPSSGDDPFGLDAAIAAAASLRARRSARSPNNRCRASPSTPAAIAPRSPTWSPASSPTGAWRARRSASTAAASTPPMARFASQASPNLLILDTLLQGPAMLHSLDRLAQVIEEGTKVVIIGAVNDIAPVPRTDGARRQRIHRAADAAARPDPHRLRALRQSRQAVRRPRHRRDRRARRHRRLHHRAQSRLVDRRTPGSRRDAARSRPFLRHRRARLQPGPAAIDRRCAAGARSRRRRVPRARHHQANPAPANADRAGDAGARVRARLRRVRES